MAEKPQPVQVLYCGVCGLPAEYCEFGPDFEKCKPWLIQHAAEIYPDLLQGNGFFLSSFWLSLKTHECFLIMFLDFVIWIRPKCEGSR